MLDDDDSNSATAQRLIDKEKEAPSKIKKVRVLSLKFSF
jgi:hypothetical protein